MAIKIVMLSKSISSLVLVKVVKKYQYHRL